MLPREKGHKYSVEHRDGLFYFRTNRDAKNFRLVTAPVSSPSPPNWKELLPHRPDVLLKGVELFQDYLVASEKSAALDHFRVLDFRSGEWHDVELSRKRLRRFRHGHARVHSRDVPLRLPEHDHARRACTTTTWRPHERTLKKRQEVPGYDPELYVTEREWAVARDGVKVPLSIVYRKGVKKDGTAPLFLYGYGSYGAGMPAGFNSNRLSLLDRGMVYVIAHIRGGDEMGEAWHDDGMLMKKKNTFHDFIDSAQWLARQRVDQQGSPGDRGRQRRRTADGCGHRSSGPISSRRSTPACRSWT